MRLGGSAVLAAALVLGLGSGLGADVLYVDIGAGDAHTCAVKANGEIACWGDNSAGQANPPAGKFSAVSAGGLHTCAVREGPGGPEHNTVACWGDNTFGQASPPVSGKFPVGVTAGRNYTCAIKADGSIVCWGANTAGQASPPNQLFGLVISAGGRHTCVVRRLQGNPAVCWGDNTAGQATPPAPGPFATISAGATHTCAITQEGRAVCWGVNNSGQATPAGDPPPLVNIALQGCSRCTHGDIVRISLDFSNPGRERTVELAFIGHFPDGVTVRSFLAPDLKVSLPPGESALRLDPATLTPDLPAGTYFLEAALLHPATGVTLSRHSVPLQLVPLSAGP
jgi:hypothetical protein